jgi:hypothetical protein
MGVQASRTRDVEDAPSRPPAVSEHPIAASAERASQTVGGLRPTRFTYGGHARNAALSSFLLQSP